jgi:hypothetical protein
MAGPAKDKAAPRSLCLKWGPTLARQLPRSGAIERAFGLLERQGRHGLKVNHGGLNVAMAQQPLDGLKLATAGAGAVLAAGTGLVSGGPPAGRGRSLMAAAAAMSWSIGGLVEASLFRKGPRLVGKFGA